MSFGNLSNCGFFDVASYLGLALLFELEDGPPKGEDELGPGIVDDSLPFDSKELLEIDERVDDETELEDG